LGRLSHWPVLPRLRLAGFQVFTEAGGARRRPDQYVGERTRKEDLARQLAERDGIAEGLVCVFATVEPCRTFSLRWREGAAFIQSARRKCLILYYYFLDRDFGLIHVRLQTWFPLQPQVYVNGHEWLARKLTQHGVRYTKHDNAFLWLEDFPRAQRFADRFVSLPWVALLDRYARRVNPLLRDVLTPMQYYWVTTQSEYATDLVFKSRQHLTEFFPRLLAHSTLCFSARDVMSFLGRKWHGKFEGEVVTDQEDLRGRLPGCRVKHRMKRNWLKMYDKAEWVPLRKNVAYLFRYRDVSLQSNARYLNALAQVEDPTSGLRGLDAITTRKRLTKAFNPVARPDCQLFTALMSGEYAVHGFANRDLRSKLAATAIRLSDDPTRQSAQVSRLCTGSTSTACGEDPAVAPLARHRVRAADHEHLGQAPAVAVPRRVRPGCVNSQRLLRKNRRTNEGRIYAPPP
jgi:hypothetical protein